MSSIELQRARQRYATSREKAYRHAAVTMTAELGVRLTITGWSNRARDAVAAQWEPTPRHPDVDHWDWADMMLQFRQPDRLDISIWVADRLACLCLGTCHAQCIHLRYLEGDPRPDCPLKGTRGLAVLETAAAYAEAMGKTELKLQPLNSSLESLYRDTYGFSLEKPPKGDPYWRKGV